MKRSVCLLAASFMIALPPIAIAQEGEESPQAALAALESTGRVSQWQNWVFAGGALAAAAIGMTFIILNQGTHDQ